MVIDDGGPHWEEIEHLLSRANAETQSLSPAAGGKDLEREAPDLLILGDGSLPLFADTTRDLAKLIISKDLSPGTVIRAREGRNIVKMGWPTDGDTLQELTRSLLFVPERKPFRTGLLIIAADGKRSFRGETADVSLTGMSFRTAGTLTTGSTAILSFGHVGTRALRLEASIVRCLPDPEGGRTLYGASFIRLSPEGRHGLERFVWGIRSRTP